MTLNASATDLEKSMQYCRQLSLVCGKISMGFTRKEVIKRLFNQLLKRDFHMSALRRAEESIKDLKKTNPFFDKYASKIASLQQASPEEFLQRVDKVTLKQNIEKSQERTYAELLRPKAPLENDKSEIPYKKLDDIMKLELIKDRPAEEINQIWLEYHKNKDVIAATMTVDQFEVLMSQGKSCPLFILPLPRSEGYEFIMLQFAANAVHFTPLLAYQVHKENAPECLNMVHYTEFKDKGIILMRGEFDSQVLTGKEAQCVANQFQMYYCQRGERKLKLMEMFTKSPASFKHNDLIKELEQIEFK